MEMEEEYIAIPIKEYEHLKRCKEKLIALPLCAILFVLMWISWGLKGVLEFFGAVLFIVALVFGIAKWMDFVNKHIKD